MPNRRFFIFLLAIAPLCGCSHDSEGREAVSGTVMLDGAPIRSGSINFAPTEGQATSGGGVISSGKYSIPRNNGLFAGKYRVSISAPASGTDKPAPAMPGEAPPPSKDLIPAEWNAASNQIVEVRKGGANSFPFEISTNAVPKK